MEIPIYQKIPANVEGRDFIIGDAHGCYDALTALLKHVDFNPQYDRLFSTGDLIDRGKKSKECISLIDEEWFYTILGNHEDLYIDKVRTLDNDEENSFSEEEKKYIQDLMPFYEKITQLPIILEVDHLLLGKFYIVHAEILPEYIFSNDNNVNIDELKNTPHKYIEFLNNYRKTNNDFYVEAYLSNIQKGGNFSHKERQKLLWSRKIISGFYEEHRENNANGDLSFIREEQISGEMKLFCGHNIVPFPVKIGQQYYLDTGAVLGYYSTPTKTSILFSRFGHEFFGLTLLDVATGTVYNYITSEKYRGQIVEAEDPLYDV